MILDITWISYFICIRLSSHNLLMTNGEFEFGVDDSGHVFSHPLAYSVHNIIDNEYDNMQVGVVFFELTLQCHFVPLTFIQCHLVLPTFIQCHLTLLTFIQCHLVLLTFIQCHLVLLTFIQCHLVLLLTVNFHSMS